MRYTRLFLPLFFMFALLSAQHGAALHALGHALESHSEQDKQAPHSPGCDKCASYAQLGSALNSALAAFALSITADAAVAHIAVSFHSAHTLAAVARAPPVILQKTA